MSERLNRYTCETCGRSVVTVDREQGVTPMFVQCSDMGGECKPDPSNWHHGNMHSSIYRGVVGTPTWEWRKPTDAEFNSYPRAFQPQISAHLAKGGLMHFRIVP